MTCVHFPLHYLLLCPNYWKITVPQDISCIQVQGLWNPVVTFNWDVFQEKNLLNEEVFLIAPGVKLNCLKSKQLRLIMNSTNSQGAHCLAILQDCTYLLKEGLI